MRAERRWAAAAGTRVHSRHWWPAGGESRPAVVLVHGLGVSSRYFVPLGRELGRSAAVGAPDLPGFGRTPGGRRVLDVTGLADALLDWLDAYGLAAPVLVASSLGCQVAVDLAARHPERAGPLVLVGPTFDAAARSTPVQAARLARSLAHERPSTPFVLAVEYLSCGTRRFVRTYRTGLRDPVETKLGRVAAPTLVVRGEHDPIAPQAWCERMARLLPHGRLAVVPGGGHDLNYSCAPALARLVLPLLDSPAPPRRSPHQPGGRHTADWPGVGPSSGR